MTTQKLFWITDIKILNNDIMEKKSFQCFSIFMKWYHFKGFFCVFLLLIYASKIKSIFIKVMLQSS